MMTIRKCEAVKTRVGLCAPRKVLTRLPAKRQTDTIQVNTIRGAISHTELRGDPVMTEEEMRS